jgi:hypothetical protein
MIPSKAVYGQLESQNLTLDRALVERFITRFDLYNVKTRKSVLHSVYSSTFIRYSEQILEISGNTAFQLSQIQSLITPQASSPTTV